MTEHDFMSMLLAQAKILLRWEQQRIRKTIPGVEVNWNKAIPEYIEFVLDNANTKWANERDKNRYYTFIYDNLRIIKNAR